MRWTDKVIIVIFGWPFNNKCLKMLGPPVLRFFSILFSSTTRVAYAPSLAEAKNAKKQVVYDEAKKKITG